jgi:hypothetical protein
VALAGVRAARPVVDAQADHDRLAHGTASFEEFWAKRGYDWREVMAQQAAEKVRSTGSASSSGSRRSTRSRKRSPTRRPPMSRSSRRRLRAERAKVAATPPVTASPLRLTASAVPATIRAEEGEGKGLPTFQGVAYTGAPMIPAGWGQIIVDLDGVKVPSQHRPALRQHDDNQIVGHTTAVKVDGDGIHVAGSFSGERQHADKVTVPARNGFQWQMSIGAEPIRTEYLDAGQTATVNGREVTGPMTISRETELKEVSFVPLGADGFTSASVSALKGATPMNDKAVLKYLRAGGSLNAAKYADADIDKMSDGEAKAALKECMAAADDADSTPVDEKADAKAAAGAAAIKAAAAKATDEAIQASREKAAAEAQRVTDIKARITRHVAGPVEIEVDGKKVDLERHAVVAGWAPDQVELHALRAGRPSAGPHFYSPSDPILNEAVIEAAVFDALRDQFKLFDSDFYKFGEDGKRRVPLREEKRITAELNARYTDQVRQAAHTRFKGRIGLQQLLTTLAAANGYRGPATFNDPGAGARSPPTWRGRSAPTGLHGQHPGDARQRAEQVPAAGLHVHRTGVPDFCAGAAGEGPEADEERPALRRLRVPAAEPGGKSSTGPSGTTPTRTRPPCRPG